MRDRADIRVVRLPPWWTPGRLAAVAAALGLSDSRVRRRLEDLDDAVFEAVAGKVEAVPQVRKLWSEIAEVVLSEERARTKDPRQAYGAMADQMQQLIRMFRDLPNKHVVMTSKLEKTQDEIGRAHV